MFDVGSLEGRLELDRTPFAAGLRAARMEGQRFERERFTATIDANADTANATRKLDEVSRDRTIHADLNLDTAAAEAKVELLKRNAAGIGGGIGGGVGGGGGGSSGGGFPMPGLMGAGVGLGALFAPTVGASAVGGALGAGALGLGAAGAAGVGLASIVATAAPAIASLKAAETAQKAYTAAVATYGKHSTEAQTAQKKLNAATAAMAPAAQKAMDAVDHLKTRWGELSQPAQTQFFGMVNDAMREAERLMPMFAHIAQEDVSAARDALDHFLAAMNSPDFHTFMRTMGDLFANSIGPAERSVENIFHVLGRIAVAAAPDVQKMFESIQDTTHHWEQDTQNAADLHQNVHRVVGDFKAWVDLAESLGHLVSALFITNNAGAKTGRQQVEGMAHALDHWSNWISHHHHDINQFFGTLQQTFGLLVGSAGEIAKVVLPAFKPVADIIHTVVSDLNSLRVGNVSALTVLLGVMAGRSIMGRLGVGGAAAGAESAAAGAGGGSLLARGLGTVGRAVGFEGAAGGALAIGGATAVGLGTFHAITDEGGILDTIHGHATANLTGELGGQLAHGIADGINKDRSVQRAVHGMTIDQLRAVRHDTLAQAHFLGTDAAQTLGNAVSDEGRRVAGQTARMASDQIKGINLGTRLADAVASGKGDVRKILKDYEDHFESLPPTVRDAAVKSAKTELDQLQTMGLITKKQERQTLNDLEDMQAQSQRKQRDKWDQFGRITNRLVAGWFGSMTNTVDTMLGNKGITGMVNQLLTGVASQHKLKWNATTLGRTAGQLAGFLNIGGGQRGGFTGGWSSFDDRLVPMRGNEAVLRGEDHVPIVSRALQSTYGFGLGDLFNRTGASNSIGGRARGGFAYPFSKSMPLGRVDEGIDAATPGAPVGALGSAVVTSNTNAFAPSYGTSNQGMVYKLLGGAPKGYEPSSPYVYIYEGLDKVGFGNRLSPGQLLGHIHASYPGIEMGWAAGPSGPALAHGHYTEGEQTAEGKSFMRLLRDLAGGKAVSGAGIGRIPRIAIHGPAGGVHDALQGIADQSRNAANHYLARQMATTSTMGGVSLKGISGSLPQEAAAIARSLRAPHRAALALFEALWAESTMGTVSSNVLQLIPSTAAAAGISQTDAKGQIASFLTNAYGFGPGAIALAKSTSEPAYAIAQDVQQSGAGAGSHGLSNYGAQKNAAVRSLHAVGYPGFLGGGPIAPGRWGAVHPPEILVPGGPHGTDVLSQQDTMKVLKQAASGSSPGDIRLIVHGDIITDRHPDNAVEAVIGDRRFRVAVQREISGRNAHGRQLVRMRR